MNTEPETKSPKKANEPTHVYLLLVEPEWGSRGRRSEISYFFPKKMSAESTGKFLAEKGHRPGVHHSWSTYKFGVGIHRTTYHG